MSTSSGQGPEPSASSSLQATQIHASIDRRLDEVTRKLTQENKRGVRQISGNLRRAAEVQQSEIQSIKGDMLNIKEDLKSIRLLLNGDQQVPGVVGRMFIAEERIKVTAKWVQAAIVGLITLLFGVIIEGIHIVTGLFGGKN